MSAPLEELLRVLNSWVGKDFNPGKTAQCAAFIRSAWSEAELPLPIAAIADDVYPETGPNMANSFAGNEIGPKVEIRDIRAGDIIMFSNTYGDFPPGTITHVGTCVGHNFMVDRSTSSHPVMKRSIFIFGKDRIKQIRRPLCLLKDAAPMNLPPKVVAEDGSEILCNPQFIDSKIRVDLKGVCNFFGYDVEYNKDKNSAQVRKKV